MKFGTRVRLKPSNDRGEFELYRAKSKINVAENYFALGHETDNTCRLISIFSKLSQNFLRGLKCNNIIGNALLDHECKFFLVVFLFVE